MYRRSPSSASAPSSRSAAAPAATLLVVLLAAASLDLLGQSAWHGSAAADLVLDPVEGRLTACGVVSIERESGPWEIEATSRFDGGAWTEQSVGLAWSADPWSVESILRFEPDRERWKDWKTEIEFDGSLASVEIEAKRTRTRAWLTLDLERSIDSFDVDARVRFRADPCSALLFHDIEITWDGAICGVETSVDVGFDADGLEEIALVVEDLAWTRLPHVAVDLDVERTSEGTEIGIDPSLHWGDGGCITLEGAFGSEESLLSFALQGLRISGAWDDAEGAVEIRFGADEWIDGEMAADASVEFDLAPVCGRDGEVECRLQWAGEPPQPLARLWTAICVDLVERVEASVSHERVLHPASAETLTIGLSWNW